MKISIQNLFFSYDAQEIIKDCNLTIASGEIVALLGPSGSGKSTLLKLILNLLTPSQGKILFNDKTSFSPSMCSSILSESSLFPWYTVEENLLLTGEHHRIHECLLDLEMASWSKYYPTGLSMGMKQKILIARMALLSSDIWLLDEPFNGLDLNSKLKVQEFLTKHRKNKTVLIVTHNIDEALSFADRILLWDKTLKRPDKEWDSSSSKDDILEYLTKSSSLGGIEC